MKKTLAVVLLLCFCTAGRSQFVIGGDLGFSGRDYSYTQDGLTAYDNSLPHGWAVAIAPRVGYAFGDQWTLGVRLGFGYSDYVHSDGFYNPNLMEWELSERQRQVEIDVDAGIWVRRRLLAWGALSFHVETNIGYGQGFGTRTLTQFTLNNWNFSDRVVTSRDTRTGRLTLTLVPVFNYAFGSHFSMDAYLDFASLAFIRKSTTIYGEKSQLGNGDKVHSHTVTYDVDLGIHSLSSRLLTIGFNYRF